MCNSNRSGNVPIDEIDLEAQLVRNKIADIIQELFARQMNYQENAVWVVR